MMTWYVLANGDLFREGLNALVTFLGDDAFDSFYRIVTAFSIYAVIFALIKGRDFSELFKWYAMMIFVSGVMVAPKADVAIYDSSNPGAAYSVDNVPASLAWIGSVFTSMGYGVTEAMETAFHLPDDLSYNKTGMLFGAKMFTASHSFQILSPELHAQMDDYIQNCVIGDMRINKKYTMDELKANQALWSLFSTNPSPVRMVTLDGEFTTCQDATPKLKQAMQDEINKQSFILYGKKIFGANGSSYQSLFEQYLTPSYSYFVNSSQTATDIFMQTMLINAMNEGVRDYAAISNSQAGLDNYVATKSHIQTQLTWKGFGVQAMYFLPLIQTTLLLLFTCFFPFVVVLSLMPRGFSHWANYLRYFAWVELWPPLFAILNMAMNYYLQAKSTALADGGVSMQTMNQMAQLHTDTMATAGYLSLMIPVLARGLLSNTVMESLSGMVSGISGSIQSATSMAATEATTGNFSMGNTSYHNVSANNTNANKHDTDWTNFQGTATEQMGSGMTKTMTEDGQTIWDSSRGMSNLPISLNLASQLSSTLSQSAEKAQSAAVSESQAMNSSLTSASSSLVQLGNSLSNEHRDGDHVSSTLSDSESRALSFLDRKADEISEREHISKTEAYSAMGKMHYGVSAGVDSSRSIAGKVAELAVGAKASATTGYSYDDTSTETSNYDRSNSHGLTATETKEVGHAFNTLASHQATKSSDISDSRSHSLVDNLAADLRSAQTASHNMNADLTQSQRLSEMATMAQTESSAVNTNLNQAFVDYVQKTEGTAKADSLFSTSASSLSSQAQLKTLANRFVSHVAQDTIQGNYESFASNVNPSGLYEGGKNQVNTQGGEGVVAAQYQNDKTELEEHKRGFVNTNGNEKALRKETNEHVNQSQESMKGGKSVRQQHQAQSKEMDNKLNQGHVDATQWTLPIPRKIAGVTILDGEQRENSDKIG